VAKDGAECGNCATVNIIVNCAWTKIVLKYQNPLFPPVQKNKFCVNSSNISWPYKNQNQPCKIFFSLAEDLWNDHEEYHVVTLNNQDDLVGPGQLISIIISTLTMGQVSFCLGKVQKMWTGSGIV